MIVQGNQRVDSETIRSYITGAGAGSLEEARRNLLQTGMFSDVRITRQGSQIVVRVSENRLINRVVFEGNRKVERATLEPELQTKARGAYIAGGGRCRRRSASSRSTGAPAAASRA